MSSALLLVASATGPPYLIGDTFDGAKAFCLDGEALTDCTPPPDLLRGRRFTALQTDAEGKLQAATDGVGVLVYDGEAWSSHPTNEHLPEIAGTGLKRVYCPALDRDGGLWVGMDDSLVCRQVDG